MDAALASLFSGVADQLVTLFGCPATYATADGDEIAVSAVFSRRQEPVGEYGERSESRWLAEIAASAVPAPQIGDTLAVAPGVLDALIGAATLSETVFTVRGIDTESGGDGFTWRLRVTLDELETDA